VFGYFCLGLCLTVGLLTSCLPVDLRDSLLPLDCCRKTLLKLTLILELCCLLVGPSLLKALHCACVCVCMVRACLCVYGACVRVCVCVRQKERGFPCRSMFNIPSFYL